MSIVNTDVGTFSLQMNIKANYIFWGRADDAVANNLFKRNPSSKSPLPSVLAGVD